MASEEKLKVMYEARYCPGMPTDCCDYGVISHETGKEVCRVWDRDDVERITDLLNTRQPTPAAEDVVKTVARAIERASFGQLHVSEPEAMARAAIAALKSRPAEAAGEEPVAWVCDGIPDAAIEAGTDALENAHREMQLREESETPELLTDWDEGMIVAAIYKAMAAKIARPATPSNPDRLVEGKFSLGQRVTKNKGSKWTGRVVGFYSTALTPIGYAIESETETGSVQIYPEAALSAAPVKDGEAGE